MLKNYNVYALMTLVILLTIGGTGALAQEDGLDVSTLEVVEATEIELVVGAANTSAYLAPNGEYFAWFGPGDDGLEICLFTIAGEVTGCTEAIPDYDSGSVSWSPDSTKLIFAQRFLQLFTDSDIWMFDAEAMTVTNLTDDDVERIDIFGTGEGSADAPVDMVPLWGADSNSVYFVRYFVDEIARSRPDLYRLDLDSGELTLIHSFTLPLPFGIYRAATSPDGRWLAYSEEIEPGRAHNLRLLDLETGKGELLAWFPESDERPYYANYLEFSPDSRYLLLHDPTMLLSGLPLDAENPVVRIFDMDGNETLIDPEQVVVGAGWLPEGAGLVYQVRDITNPQMGALFVSSEPGQPGHQLVEGYYLGTTTYQERIDWGANNALLVTVPGGFPLTVFQMAAGS